MTGNLVEGNTLGLSPSGSSALPNTWGGVLNLGASDNAYTGNTISGNTDGGLELNGKGTSNDTVQGNVIGTDSAGDSGLGNSGDGVVVKGGGTLNLIGGSAPGDGNLISGSGAYGVLLTGAGTGENTLQGNTIGTTPSTIAGSPNVWGVGITGGAVNDTLTVNVISGNKDGGVALLGNGTSGNQLLGNYVGTDPAGDAVGNGGDGVLIDGGATGNTIGGSQSSDGNQVGFNGGGVILSGSSTTGDALLSDLIFSSGPNRSGPGIKLIGGADGGLAPPKIKSITTSGSTGTTITGTGAPSATVQTFGNGSCTDPEGKTLLGTAHSDSSGNWSMLVPAVQHGAGVTAAQTTASSDSSPFSACVSSP